MLSGLLKRNPALLARIMPRSLWLSPLAMVSNPMLWSAFTVVSLDCSQRILNPVISPSGATSSVLQKIVGIPSFFMRGPANWENVSEIMITWEMDRSSSRNSFAPGMGSIFAMVSWISFRPRPCSLRIPRRHFISLS